MSKTKTAVLYIHGFGGAGTSTTAAKLAEALGDGYQVIAPDRDEGFPASTLRAFSDLYEALDNLYDEVIIVGSSLGGFYANQLALVCHAKALLINPVLFPSDHMGRRITPFASASYADLEKDRMLLNDIGATRIVMIGTEDDVVDPIKNGNMLAGRARIVEVNMGHRLTNFIHASCLIEELVNNVSEAGGGD